MMRSPAQGSVVLSPIDDNKVVEIRVRTLTESMALGKGDTWVLSRSRKISKGRN